MTIIIRGTILAAGALAATLGFGVAASTAAMYGDEPWCAVSDEGAAVYNWDCEYATVDDCQPAIIAGNRGFCQRNPYWQPPQPSTAPPPPTAAQPLPLQPPRRN